MDGRKKLIEKAGMLLTDDELEMIAGGASTGPGFGGNTHKTWTGDIGPKGGNLLMMGEAVKEDN